jgi:uncharacterized protein (TIGR02246 family)
MTNPQPTARRRAESPEEVATLFMEYLDKGDLPGLVSLYAPHALFVPMPGTHLVGTTAIGEALQQMIDSGARLKLELREIRRVDDVALVSNTATLTTATPDVNPVTSTTTELLRRQADGGWVHVVDDPFFGVSVTSPGRLTSPTTLTTTGPSGSGAGLPDVGLADETICTGGSFAETTGGGSSRTSVNTVTSTAMTPTAASATTPARPGSARIAAIQLGPPVVGASGSHRDSDVSGSSPSDCSGSAASDPMRRRCTLSAGSSVRMPRR